MRAALNTARRLNFQVCFVALNEIQKLLDS